MDRERLKEVHASDLTEGRINQDFLDWLKTKGVSYLLVLMILLCAYLAYVRWSGSRLSYRAEAWSALSQATDLPTSLEGVADEYEDVGAVADLARLRAAQQLLVSVQASKTVGATPEERKELSAEDRAQYLARADGLYEKILAGDDGSMGKTLIAYTALTSRAAIAESQGKPDSAKQFFAQAAERVEKTFPELAEQARKRAETVVAQATPTTFPAQADLSKLQSTPPKLDPVPLDPWIRDLIMPEDAGGEAGDE